MAGIDNNTLLYLRGDRFEDLSPNPKSITNSGATVSDLGKLGKCYSINNSNFKTSNFIINGDFTIEGYVYLDSSISSDITRCFINASNGETVGDGNLLIWFIYRNGIHEIYSHFGTGSSWGAEIKYTTIPIFDKWFHIALTRSGNSFTLFFNGKNVGTTTYNLGQFTNLIFGDIFNSSARKYINGKLENIRLSNIARYKEDFTPPTQPYNSITINKTNQTDTNIEFSIEKLGQETINKVEVLINEVVSKTYTDSYDNIDYLIDTELCVLGNNNITIRVTFDDTYTEELSLTHTYTVDKLPTETPLLDTVERVKLLTKSKQNEKDMLSNILTSKNVEVSEEDKMSDLIGKVDLLGEYNDKLWLYKDGDEYTDVTGGFVSHQAQSKPPTLTKTSSYMEYKAQSGSYTSGHYGTNLPINITDYSLLKFEVETLNMGSTHYGCNFGLTTNKDMGSSVAAIQITTNKSKHIISLDISSISGLNYVYSDTTYNNTSRIYKIWLEK